MFAGVMRIHESRDRRLRRFDRSFLFFPFSVSFPRCVSLFLFTFFFFLCLFPITIRLLPLRLSFFHFTIRDREQEEEEEKRAPTEESTIEIKRE